MTLSARPDKGCVDDGEFCILQQLLTKKKLLNIGQTEDIQLSLYNRGFYVTIRVALALLSTSPWGPSM